MLLIKTGVLHQPTTFQVPMTIRQHLLMRSISQLFVPTLYMCIMKTRVPHEPSQYEYSRWHCWKVINQTHILLLFNRFWCSVWWLGLSPSISQLWHSWASLIENRYSRNYAEHYRHLINMHGHAHSFSTVNLQGSAVPNPLMCKSSNDVCKPFWSKSFDEMVTLSIVAPCQCHMLHNAHILIKN